jgi:ATP-dependent protease HslVU (ClpYQ) peptidase subunit
MTAIIGLAENGVVYIGGDSCAGDDWTARSVKHSKVFKMGNFLIGYTDSFRMGQLLEHNLHVTPQGGESDVAYMVKVFAEAVRTCLKNGGYAEVEKSQESGGEFLVGYHGKIYLFQSDFSVLEYIDNFVAVGHGFLQALAVMQALADVSPKERIKRALEITACISQYVQPPFHIISSEDSE